MPLRRRKSTIEAQLAAKEWEDLTGWYGVAAVGRDVQLTVTVDQLKVLMANWQAANPKTTT